MASTDLLSEPCRACRTILELYSPNFLLCHSGAFECQPKPGNAAGLELPLNLSHSVWLQLGNILLLLEKL